MSESDHPDSPVFRRVMLRHILASLNRTHMFVTANYDDSMADLLDAIDAAIERTQQLRT